MVIKIETSLPISNRRYQNKSKESKIPAFYCKSCNSNCNGYCSFYSRKIKENNNKCFNHSNYSPVATKFKAPEHLNEIIEREEKERNCVA